MRFSTRFAKRFNLLHPTEQATRAAGCASLSSTGGAVHLAVDPFYWWLCVLYAARETSLNKASKMILCCGEALIDMIPGESGAFTPCAGGAVFNTAVALGRLEVPVGLLSGVSRDKFGLLLADVLAENGVATDLLARSDRLTTLAIVHLENGSATYSFYDENSAGRMLKLEEMPSVPETVQALFFGGISLACEPAAEAYAGLLARDRGARLVMLDPNIRPSFITDEAAFRARLDRMLGLSDVVKVSDEDLAWIIGGREDLEAQARALAARGPGLVIVTRGGEGAIAVRASGTVAVPAQRAQVVDTVGAGDTFNAGFLAALQEAGQLSRAGVAGLSAADLAAALSYGAKVAGIVVARKGANPPYKSEL